MSVLLRAGRLRAVETSKTVALWSNDRAGPRARAILRVFSDFGGGGDALSLLAR
jgi:hypothetical protein